MSAWVKGKLDLKCSLDLLKRAISNIMPQWADHIKTDPAGKLVLYRYNRQPSDQKCNLLLPGSGNVNFPEPPNRGAENDWGWKKNAEGTWDTISAEFHEAEAEVLQQKIKAEVTRMRILAVAKLRGYQVSQSSQDKGKSKIRLVVDEDTAKQIMSMA